MHVGDGGRGFRPLTEKMMVRRLWFIAVVAFACAEGSQTLEVSDVDFGQLVVGAEAVEYLPRTSPDLTAAVASPFSVQGIGAAWKIEFRPERPGTFTSMVQIEGSTAEVRSTFRLRGVARAPEVLRTPESIDLGTVPIGQVRWHSFRLNAETSLPLRWVEGASRCPAAWCVRPLLEEDAESTESAEAWAVRWAPDQPGRFERTLQFETCPDPACAVEVSVRGEATVGGVFCTPSPVDFGPVAVGGRSVVTVRCQEDGEPLDLRMTGSSHPDLTWTATPQGAELAYAPRRAGSMEDTLSLYGRAVSVRGWAVEAPDCTAQAPPVSFGASLLFTEATSVVRVENIGQTPCLWSSTHVPMDGPANGSTFPFRLVPPIPQPRWISAGQVASRPIAFVAPAPGVYRTRLVPHLAPPSHERRPVSVVAAVGGGPVEVRPPELVLTHVSRCTSRQEILRLDNRGVLAARWISAGLEGPDADRMQVRSSLPQNLPAGGSVPVEVQIDVGATNSDFSAELQLGFEMQGAPAGQLRVPILAEIPSEPPLEVYFEQLDRPSLDLLLVVENGPDMAEEHQLWRDELAGWLHGLVRSGMDVQIAVTTTDGSGQLRSMNGMNVFTQTSTPAAWRAAQVGTEGSTVSQGLLSIVTAVTDIDHGLVREDAVLSVLILSDRDDRSSWTVDDVQDALVQQKRGLPFLVSVSAIAGPEPTGCMGEGRSASPSPRYRQLVNQTGGLFISICQSDWLTAPDVDLRFGFRSRFMLPVAPVVSSLEVFVNGVRVPAENDVGQINWQYDAATESINFSTRAVPPPGAQIVVRFLRGCG